MAFAYKTTFFPLRYAHESGVWTETTHPPQRHLSFPDPEPNAELEAHMNDLGREGWELVSTQPFWRSEDHSYSLSSGGLLDSRTERIKNRVSVFMGYWFFWKKAVGP